MLCANGLSFSIQQYHSKPDTTKGFFARVMPHKMRTVTCSVPQWRVHGVGHRPVQLQPGTDHTQLLHHVQVHHSSLSAHLRLHLGHRKVSSAACLLSKVMTVLPADCVDPQLTCMPETEVSLAFVTFSFHSNHDLQSRSCKSIPSEFGPIDH